MSKGFFVYNDGVAKTLYTAFFSISNGKGKEGHIEAQEGGFQYIGTWLPMLVRIAYHEFLQANHIDISLSQLSGRLRTPNIPKSKYHIGQEVGVKGHEQYFSKKDSYAIVLEVITAPKSTTRFTYQIGVCSNETKKILPFRCNRPLTDIDIYPIKRKLVESQHLIKPKFKEGDKLIWCYQKKSRRFRLLYVSKITFDRQYRTWIYYLYLPHQQKNKILSGQELDEELILI